MRDLIKTETGYLIRITGEEVYTQHEEVAAWFTDVRLDEGEYVCAVTDAGGYWEAAGARIPGTVVRNNHSSLFGGVPVAPGPDRTGERVWAYVSASTKAFTPEGQ